MLDGRLNAQAFPGPQAIDLLFRLMTVRGVRGVGVAKSGLLLDVVRPLARAIRRRVGWRPFCFPILREHLLDAYRGQQVTSSPKTLRPWLLQPGARGRRRGPLCLEHLR